MSTRYFSKVVREEFGDEVSAGAEIGCLRGVLSQELLREFPVLTLHCVDPWGTPDYRDGSPYSELPQSGQDHNYQVFLNRIAPYRDRCHVHRCTSAVAANIVEGPLDFAFIDANHKRPFVEQDIRIWTPKVRIGGLIAGHDYHHTWPGVVEAVDHVLGPVEVTTHGIWFQRKDTALDEGL